MNFLEKWENAIHVKNSVLCAGLDPAEFGMGRKEKGLADKVSKRDWALKYVESVAPFCAAVKPNFQYWKDKEDVETLHAIEELANMKQMVVIDDSKLADIGSTNEAGFYYGAQRADAITVAPYAGNVKEAGEQARKWKVGAITMCLMSNPQYRIEKNKWEDISELLEEHPELEEQLAPDIKMIQHDGQRIPHVRQYIALACKANVYGLDGIVIGAPSEDNHIEEFELSDAKEYSRDDTLVLLPGVGAQGGEADKIWTYFSPDRVIVNVGRSLMLPHGSNSTSAEQAKTAKEYQTMLNELRADR